MHMRRKKIDSATLGQNAKQASQFLKSIANPHRLMILCALLDGELSVGELNDRIDISQSMLSQHLAVLRQSGHVQTRREAQTIYYSLHSREVELLMNCLYKIFCG